MKKFLLAILAVGSLTAAQAQKGSILAYGNVGYGMLKDSAKNEFSMFNVNPGVGYQVSDNFTLGLSGGYSSWTDKPIDTNFTKTGESMMNIGVFFRYTKYVGNSPFFVFAQVDAGYMSGQSKNADSVVTTSKHSGFGASFTPAVGINVCHGFALNFSFGGIGFTSDKYTEVPNQNAATTFDITLGQQMHFGISKNFGGHKKSKGHAEPMDDTRRIDTSDDEETAPKKKPARTDDDE